MRIWVRGSSGSGKSTLAKRLAETLDLDFIEMDDIHWLPDWKERPKPETRAILEEKVAGERWVVAGNYKVHGEVILPRATMIIWLDPSLARTTWQLTLRTYRRIFLREPCCNGNHERFLAHFTRDGIFWWMFSTFYRRRRECLALFEDPALDHVRRVRLRTRREVMELVERLGAEQ